MGKSSQLLIVTGLIHSSETQIRCTISRIFFFLTIKTFHSVKQRLQLAAWDVSATYIWWKCKCKCAFNSPVHSTDMSPSLIPSIVLDLYTHVFVGLEKHHNHWLKCVKSYCRLSYKTPSAFASTVLTDCKIFPRKSKKPCRRSCSFLVFWQSKNVT